MKIINTGDTFVMSRHVTVMRLTTIIFRQSHPTFCHLTSTTICCDTQITPKANKMIY